MLPLIANATWFASSVPHRRRFLSDAARADLVQAFLLSRLLSANADTQFGREHGFSEIRNLEEYRRRVPIRSYEAFLPWIEQAADGRPGVLTAEPVLLFEPTGGSTGGSKLIPYTRSLHREFQLAIAVWVADIFATFPGAMRGTSYWSVSPPGHATRQTRGGIPIGFADDVEYLGGLARFVRHAMAAPPELARIANPDRFMDATALALLRRADLSIVSVWNPSFLLLLLERIRSHHASLIRELHEVDRHRARAVEKAFGDGDAFERLWPRLRLVSCWADAAARSFAEQLARELPGVRIQGKGLLATEGLVTLPLFGAGGSVPAYRSHVLEFLDDGGDCHCIGGIVSGVEYAVLLTTGGGLYRYALGDRVRVTGSHAGLPTLEFVGRAFASDLVGEKLDARHVQCTVEAALAGAGVASRFAMLAPEAGIHAAGYVLFLETPNFDRAQAAVLAERIERGLIDNMQYAHARRLGQLEPVRVFHIEHGGLETFLRRSAKEGQALGDVKPTALDPRTGWTACFTGDILSAQSASTEGRREEVTT